MPPAMQDFRGGVSRGRSKPPRYLPSAVNLCSRALFRSVTWTSSFLLMAMPMGEENSPGSLLSFPRTGGTSPPSPHPRRGTRGRRGQRRQRPDDHPHRQPRGQDGAIVRPTPGMSLTVRFLSPTGAFHQSGPRFIRGPVTVECRPHDLGVHLRLRVVQVVPVVTAIPADHPGRRRRHSPPRRGRLGHRRCAAASAGRRVGPANAVLRPAHRVSRVGRLSWREAMGTSWWRHRHAAPRHTSQPRGPRGVFPACRTRSCADRS